MSKCEPNPPPSFSSPTPPHNGCCASDWCMHQNAWMKGKHLSDPNGLLVLYPIVHGSHPPATHTHTHTHPQDTCQAHPALGRKKALMYAKQEQLLMVGCCCSSQVAGGGSRYSVLIKDTSGLVSYLGCGMGGGSSFLPFFCQLRSPAANRLMLGGQ